MRRRIRLGRMGFTLGIGVSGAGKLTRFAPTLALSGSRFARPRSTRQGTPCTGGCKSSLPRVSCGEGGHASHCLKATLHQWRRSGKRRRVATYQSTWMDVSSQSLNSGLGGCPGGAIVSQPLDDGAVAELGGETQYSLVERKIPQTPILFSPKRSKFSSN